MARLKGRSKATWVGPKNLQFGPGWKEKLQLETELRDAVSAIWETPPVSLSS